MRTETVKIYTLSELNERAKQEAIDNTRNNPYYLDYEWHSFTIDDFKHIAGLIGVDIDKVYFSGFYSQGGGACFIGTYAYSKGGVKKLIDFAPEPELIEIVKKLQEIQSKYFYSLTATIEHSGMYYHEQSVTIDVESELNDNLPYGRHCRDATGIDEALRDLMAWLYNRLENQYNYLMSDEAITEHILTNELEFYVDGEIY